MPPDLERAILELLAGRDGLLAREIGDALGKEKRDINSALYGSLKGRVVQDRRYRWTLAKTGAASGRGNDVEAEAFADTDLSRLCRYYLACIGFDETGVSVFASSNSGHLDYTELEDLPLSSDAFDDNPAVNRLMGMVRRERGHKALYLGYPSLLRSHRARSGWQGHFVEPVLLFPIEQEEGSGRPILDLSFPIINQAAFRNLTNADRDSLMTELTQLEDELGISGDGDAVEIDDLAMRLSAIRPEWPWREDIEPTDLATDPSLASLPDGGIYNRAVLLMADRSPFTAGLESELKMLAGLQESSFGQTALGQWISGQTSADQCPTFEGQLIELLPMNLEQREAVRSALSRPLTVITGPPGTGKSQVVTNILANAAWHGKRVLFASKNNQAVDVVETRINALGPRPILLRVGSQKYQTRLAEFLLSLMAATIGRNDKQAFEEEKSRLDTVMARLDALDAKAEAVIEVRNTVDELERRAEAARETLGKRIFAMAAEIDTSQPRATLTKLQELVGRADRASQSSIVRLFWFLFRSGRLEQVNELAHEANGLTARLELPTLPVSIDEGRLEDVASFCNMGLLKLGYIDEAARYFASLKRLQEQPRLEQLGADRKVQLETLAKVSASLWKIWLRLQPARLSAQDRSMLSRYNSLLQMVIDAGPEGLTRQVAGQYKGLHLKVSHLLPCWAVTSLSAKGRLPFEPGYFDLVVIDEASQCDIASALPLLYRAKAAVIIGDPMQLAHISSLPRGQDQKLLERYELVEGYPQWAYSFNSLFSLAAGQVAGDEIVALLDHHRSHSDIISFSNDQFYEERLRVATNYDSLNFPRRGEPGVRWVDTPGKAVRPSSGGAVNSDEVSGIVRELRKLAIEQDYRGTIGVVSPFRAQINAIKEAVARDRELDHRLGRSAFLADTVHKFQGDERDVMFFSPVVSKDSPRGAIGFLNSNGNLFNVAITRARAQLIVVGDLSACLDCEIDYLENFAKYSVELSATEARNVEDAIVSAGADYPCVANPDQVSDWEKVLYRALYAAGIASIPQYQVEKFALDLLVTDGRRKLDVEVDGERYHKNWTGELCRRDQLRNHRLFELGFDVMRFWVYEIRDDLPGCVEKVRSWIDGR